MVKKTGTTLDDHVWVNRDGEPGHRLDTFKVHFPNIDKTNPTSAGVTVTVDLEMLKMLQKKVDHQLCWTCPKCGNELHNYRRSELDWDYKKCSYCGWDER